MIDKYKEQFWDTSHYVSKRSAPFGQLSGKRSQSFRSLLSGIQTETVEFHYGKAAKRQDTYIKSKSLLNLELNQTFHMLS
ncbi:hypothetical protein L596_010003 [Steinernema carpocapsae]|uniref:Uncharacterized protein n=1 Tax=Steinernema carpocapsae TaxID=34508 RepID=A0A4V6A6R7_STECR|nr:hypothetical protein L596_010003 [Steinernema carpocapsae]